MKKCRDLINPPNHTENIAAIINNMPQKHVRTKIFPCLYVLSLAETNTHYRTNLKSKCAVC